MEQTELRLVKLTTPVHDTSSCKCVSATLRKLSPGSVNQTAKCRDWCRRPIYVTPSCSATLRRSGASASAPSSSGRPWARMQAKCQPGCPVAVGPLQPGSGAMLWSNTTACTASGTTSTASSSSRPPFSTHAVSRIRCKTGCARDTAIPTCALSAACRAAVLLGDSGAVGAGASAEVCRTTLGAADSLGDVEPAAVPNPPTPPKPKPTPTAPAPTGLALTELPPTLALTLPPPTLALTVPPAKPPVRPALTADKVPARSKSAGRR
mmetsp:Transcript_83182/g.239070  ORF Transcript_83182/g.239070 Transcript_83182/m.239070 type:complete len:265 (-) Transcript_83182:320-1114(-)